MGRTRNHLDRLRRHNASQLRRQIQALLQYQIAHIVQQTRKASSLSRVRRFIAAKKIVNFINKHYKKDGRVGSG